MNDENSHFLAKSAAKYVCNVFTKEMSILVLLHDAPLFTLYSTVHTHAVTAVNCIDLQNCVSCILLFFVRFALLLTSFPLFFVIARLHKCRSKNVRMQQD